MPYCICVKNLNGFVKNFLNNQLSFYFMKNPCCKFKFLIPVFIIAFLAIFSFVVYELWNNVLVDVLGVETKADAWIVAQEPDDRRAQRPAHHVTRAR